MKAIRLLGGVLACLSVAAGAAADATAVAEGTAIGERLPQFTAAITHLGGAEPKTAPFDSRTTAHLTAYVFIATTCPATSAYIERFKDLERHYGPRGVDFIYLYPNRSDTPDVQQRFHKEKGFAGALIDDRGGRLAQLFKAKRTTEIFLVDTKGLVVFHGAVDDSREPRAITTRYLAPALDDVLAGKPVTTPTSDVFACAIHP